ncbi:pseudouridine kinase isoform X4 [Diospyros lotus]|uniref:pseudouridine kinase isoform X4 n=1 Tax=Diospyros lotus TaxID=55363 RepID=UPI00225C1932|nr:pseudouridine kinase isoform X4 [Diospyros lotus]
MKLPPPSEPSRPLHSVFVKGGEVKDAEGEPVIIGGMVLDVHATPSMPANPRTTTPGKVYHIPGGVARNVAECMSKLGIRPYMISAMGLDMAGNLLLEYWKSAGLSMGVAVQSDVPVWFEPVSVVKSRRVVSVVESITFASPNEDELIAMANALSCGDVFHPIHKNNRNIGCSIESLFQMLRPAIWVLLEKGIKVVIVTLGSDGVFLCSRGPPGFKKNGSKKSKLHDSSSLLYRYVNSSCPPNQFFGATEHETSSNLFAVHFPALPASVVRLTGAGDCLVGATLACISAGLDVIQSLAVGIAAAKAAVEAETNVPADYSLAKVAVFTPWWIIKSSDVRASQMCVEFVEFTSGDHINPNPRGIKDTTSAVNGLSCFRLDQHPATTHNALCNILEA